jgi:hypothetical protein
VLIIGDNYKEGSMEILDLAQFAVLGAIIAGVNELIKRLRAADWWAATTIITAALIGAIFGAAGYYPDVDAAEGLALGFGAVGVYGLTHRSSPEPSSPVRLPKA